MIDREIQVNKDHTFQITYYESGVVVDYDGYNPAPSFVISDSSGTEVFSADCTVVDYALNCFFPAADNDTVDSNYILSITHGDNIDTYLFDVVKVAIRNTVSDEDLFLYADDLRTKIYDRQSRTSDSGSENMLIDSALESEYRDLKGGRLIIFSDTKEHEAMITDYSRTGGTVYFHPDYTEVVAADVQYVIRSSFTQQIQVAFEYVRTDIRGKVPIESGYITIDAIKVLIVYRALWLISQQYVEAEGDRWDLRAKRFEAEYVKSLTRFSEAYDTSEDGLISDDENDNKPQFGRIEVMR